MIVFYQSYGAGDFELLRRAFDNPENKKIISNAKQLLERRGYVNAANLLASIDFTIWEGTNNFSDDFCVLYTEVPLDRYESLRTQETKKDDFKRIAEVLTEIGPFIRFIACELKMEINSEGKTLGGIFYGDILKLVNEYIGVHGGYLGDFSYRTHEEFYPQFCELDLDPTEYEGTTRERFIQILRTANKMDQSKIVRGVLRKYPEGSEPQRTQTLFKYFDSLIKGLEGSADIPSPDPKIASDVLKRTLADAETLISRSGAVSAVDRIHTALHSYLRAVCDNEGIEYDPDPSLTQLFKVLREKHPAFVDSGIGSTEISKILRACATIIDALNPIRNRTSVAHPNELLLADVEAMLVVNVTRSILHYLDAKFSS